MDSKARKENLKCFIKKVKAFENEGCVYLGDYNKAIDAFVKEEPYPADFHVWLQKNYTQVK